MCLGCPIVDTCYTQRYTTCSLLCLASFTQYVLTRCIHVEPCVETPFISMTEWYSIIPIAHIWFFCSSWMFMFTVCLLWLLIQSSWVVQACLTLCNPMDCSMPSLPVHHQLPELIHTHVHWVSDVIQSSHHLASPSPPTFHLSQLFPEVYPVSQLFASDGQSIGVSVSILVFPTNIQEWVPLGWAAQIPL